MRFTKIPLIATLMAVALSLLIVLPTLAQVSGDRTDGRLSAGSWVDARVASNLDDLDRTATAAGTADIPASIDTGVASYAVAGFDARDTYFNGDLYASNDDKAYNTVLITARVAENTAGVDAKATNIASVLSGPDGKSNGDGTTGLGTPGTAAPNDVNIDNLDCLGDGVAVATIKNVRSNTTVRAYLPVTTSTTGTGAIYQGTVAVWDQEDEVGAEAHSGPCHLAHTDPARYLRSAQQLTDAGAAFTAGNTALDTGDGAGGAPDGSIDADEAAVYFPEGNDGWTTASSALIPARDGDTLTITVKGVAGSITVIVDGDAPEIEDATPDSGGTQNKTTVALGFRVSDDGAGIRYDGESGGPSADDLTPFNGDRDQRFDEPITNADNTATTDINEANGSTMDIEVRFGTKDSAYNPVKVDAAGDRIAAPSTVTAILVDGTHYYFDSDDSTYYLLVDDTKVANLTPGSGMVGLTADRNANFNDDTESSQYGSNGWTQVLKGVTYDLDMRLVGKTFGTYYWQVTATDRVGNKATTDSDDDQKGKQPYSFKVDDAGPRVEVARTGVGYKPGPGEGEFANRSWISLDFINGTDSTKAQRGGADRIDASTVEASDFTVEGHTVVGALVPGDKKICVGDDPTTDEKEDARNITAFNAGNGKPAVDDDGEPIADAEAPEKCNFEPRARIYLELGDELGSDETPTIQLLGGILKDIAGNNNETQSLTSAGGEVLDRIAPGVSITITSSNGATGRAAADNEGSFTVRVASDEDLRQFPRLYFATMKGTAAFEDGKPGLVGEKSLRIADVNADAITFVEKENNVWETKVKATDITGNGVNSPITEEDDRLVAVIVTATDEEDNSGNSAGWTPTVATPVVNDKLNFKKLDAGGFLLEIDSTIMPAKIDVLPPTDPKAANKNKTESMNPYIQITFSERNEYGISVTDAGFVDDPADDEDEAASGTSLAADIGSGDKSGTDSHRNVTLTTLTLNGNDVLAEAVQVDPWKYVLALTGLEIGEYELVYAANDDVGNKIEADESAATFEFEVQERQPYEVDLNPGWNLISLPGDPFNPAVGQVIGDLKADTVLGYQGGEWVTSVKNEDGRWQGTLVDIRGGYGYWVRTTAVETIETVIPPTLPTSNLPTVPVVSGWNLVGVVDAEQRDTGTAADADDYFTSLPAWRVAYSFETQQNRWAKLLPNGGTATDPHEVENGKGYWVWSSQPGTLVP